MVAQPRKPRASFPPAALTSRAKLLAAGFSESTIDRLIQAGDLVRLGVSGVYLVSGRPVCKDRDLHVVALQYPTAVLCLLTALYLHGLTTASPRKVWFAVDRQARAPALAGVPRELFRMSAVSLKHGVVERDLDGVMVRFTSLPKTVCDCLKFQRRVGLDVALESLRLARHAHHVSARELLECAAVTHVGSAMRHYLEVLG